LVPILIEFAIDLLYQIGKTPKNINAKHYSITYLENECVVINQ